MEHLYNYSLEELTEYFKSINEKPFRAKQVFQWLYQKNAFDFQEMSNISKDLREKLEKQCIIDTFEIQEKQVSSDGTIKYLFKMIDGNLIEAVLMRHDYGQSLCVTSQVGCNMQCAFCASGLLKKQRNLTAGEMVNQVMAVTKDTGIRVSHVVVMGTGEPFDNYDEVMKFVRIINHPHGLAIGARHITISTCGLVNMIERYSNEGIQTNLAISLHAPNDEIRDQLMPVNKAFNMDSLRKGVADYIEKTNRRVTFEYILLDDVNDSLAHARQLAHYMRGLNAYVNLIPYNSVDEHGFKPSSHVEEFKDELLRLHINCTVRKEHGRDIDGACGQLRAKRSGGDIMEYYALTDIGKIREKNQDQAATAINLKDQVLGVVCDGMGGHKAGEIASHVVEEHVLTCFKANPPFLDDEGVTNWLMDTVLEAHQIVKRMANMQEDTKGMGTTVAIAVVDGDDAFFCHVGDSRIYVYDDQEIIQMTRDHTLVNELIQRGAITEEEGKNHRQKNVLMQAIGVEMNIVPDIQKYKLNGKNILICSDGLFNSLEDEEILNIVKKNMNVKDKVHLLIEQANEHGGHDNIAAVLIEGGR